jgi:outer membrane protein assembly factor BamB
LLLAACGGSAVGGAFAGTAAPAPRFSAAPASRIPDGDWTRFDYDAQRSGVGPAQTGITAGNLRSLRARIVRLDGTVDSSAIQLHAIKARGRVRDVVIVTTSYGRTIAIDPGSGTKLWEFVPRGIHAYEGSSQITNASPVADPDRRYVYASSPDGWIHKLAVASGRQVWSARVTFDAGHEKIGSALNLAGRDVIVATGGYIGDAPPYQGHVLLIDRATGHRRRVWNALCSNRHYLIGPPSSCRAFSTGGAAIWSRAGVVVEPGSGRLLLATGNGPFNGSTDWGDSALELAPDASHLLHNWTPRDQSQLDANDTDLGSTSPALLTGGLAVQGGKAGVLSLLDLRRLNGTRGRAGRRLGGELQDIQSPGSDQVFAALAVWKHSGRTFVFAADDSGTWGYYLGRDRRLHVAWEDGNAGSSPVVAGGLLYVFDKSDGTLRIIRPTSGRTLLTLPADGGHWNSPIVIGGRIIEPVGNANDHYTTGKLYIYHLPGR